MQIWLYTFIVSGFLIFYNYAGYAVIAVLLNKLKRKKSPPANNDNYQPSVSFIVAAFNEEDCIREKILNSQEQHYPTGKIEYIFITDGSSDRTPAVVSLYPGIRLLHQDERRGKPAAMNRAVQHATGEILIFSDANTILNKEAIRNIARHYANPKVGGVAGEKKVASSNASHEVGAGEGLYWKYESALKKIDSEFYSVAGAAGELFSVRKSLYEPVPDNTLLDDFVVSLKVAQKGYRIIYEPEAFATELPSASIKDEQKRKIRISAGGFQSIVMLSGLLQFWKQPRLSFVYISHRVLRWTVTPLCLILALLSNLVLVFQMPHPVIRIAFIAQSLFYIIAILAKLFPRSIGRQKLFKLPYYFVFMNVSVIQGFFRFLRGRQTILWEKAKREPSVGQN